MSDKYQSVVIRLSDGRAGVFTGRALVDTTDVATITSVKFTLPEELPSNCSFEEIGASKCTCHQGSVCTKACESRHHEGCGND
jgi:hypothetical protein